MMWRYQAVDVSHVSLVRVRYKTHFVAFGFSLHSHSPRAREGHM
jgi:hypothetical protein